MSVVMKVFLFITGLCFLAFAWYFHSNSKAFLENSMPAVGTVKDYHIVENLRTGNTRSFVYYPIIEYEANGQLRTFQSRIGLYPPKYEIGEQMVIRYRPDNPSVAIERDRGGLYAASGFTGFIGFLLIFFAVGRLPRAISNITGNIKF